MSEVTALTLDGIREILDGSPAITALGVLADSVDAEELEVVLSLPLSPHLERAPGSGQFHGGPLASLADIAGDLAVALVVGGGVPTIDLRVDFLRPAITPVVRASARVRKAGRSIALADVEIRDEEGRLCAVARGTYSSRIG